MLGRGTLQDIPIVIPSPPFRLHLRRVPALTSWHCTRERVVLKARHAPEGDCVWDVASHYLEPDVLMSRCFTHPPNKSPTSKEMGFSKRSSINSTLQEESLFLSLHLKSLSVCVHLSVIWGGVRRIIFMFSRHVGKRWETGHVQTHRIHVWYIYQHLVDVYCKCR